MCRLALMNKSFVQQVNDIELASLFQTLDDKNGGHGMGITLAYSKNDPVTYKGINHSAIDLAQLIYAEIDNPDLRYIIFHTRLASSGEICDEMCHPFSENTLYGLTLAHNGVISSLSGSDTFSDTFILYQLLTQYNLPLNNLENYSGVFVGVHHKLPFVFKSTSWSSLDLAHDDNFDAWCFCSDFYHHAKYLQARFTIHKNLGEFSWGKRLEPKDISKMLSIPHKYDRYDYTATTTNYGYSKYVKPETVQTSSIKKRTLGKRVTYHLQDCDDWVKCDGCAIE